MAIVQTAVAHDDAETIEDLTALAGELRAALDTLAAEHARCRDCASSPALARAREILMGQVAA